MLSEVGDRVYAYLQRDGGWGWSNSGLVIGDGGALVVDTLFDLPLTRAMLDAYAGVLGGASIDVLVNSHANGDHCFGNELLGGARIVASRATAEEMPEAPPHLLAGMLRAAPDMGITGEYLTRIFGPFQFDGITLTLPTETFDGELTLHAGGREVRLIDVGPAHTRGDTIVHLPGERLVFTADILFRGGHPMVWAGPVANWVRALDTVLALDAETVVPGHGPVTDRHGVEELRGYFLYLEREARQRYDAGMSAMDAALDISFADYASWGEAERIVVTIESLYSEWSGGEPPARPLAFAEMAELDSRLRA